MPDIRLASIVRVNDDSRREGCFGEVLEVRRAVAAGEQNLYRVRLNHNFTEVVWFREEFIRLVETRLLYSNAVFAVDPGASNLSGLVHSLSHWLPYIRYEVGVVGGGTREVNKHPAVVLFVSQMTYLATGDCIDPAAYSEALSICRKRAATM